MKSKYFVIADPDTVLGFRCVGVPGAAVSTREAALEAIRWARDAEVGVLILTQGAASMVQQEIEELRFNEALPLVVEISGPEGPMPGRRTLAEIIREAIGVRV